MVNLFGETVVGQSSKKPKNYNNCAYVTIRLDEYKKGLILKIMDKGIFYIEYTNKQGITKLRKVNIGMTKELQELIIRKHGWKIDNE